MQFPNPITGAQGALVYPRIKSPNYVAGVSGWSIEKDGSAEFNDVVVRGEVNVIDADGSYVKIINEDPGDGAIIEMRPADSVGTVNAPARIATGTDPVTGSLGIVITGPDIDAGAVSQLAFHETGVTLATDGGIYLATLNDGPVTVDAGAGDVEIIDDSNVVRFQFSGATGRTYVTYTDTNDLAIDLGTSGTSGDVTVSDDNGSPVSIARGYRAHDASTSSTGAITSETIVATIANFPFRAGRAYRITATGGAGADTDFRLNFMQVRHTNLAGIRLLEFARVLSGANVCTLNCMGYLRNDTSTDETITVVLTAQRVGGAGSVSIFGSADSPRTFVIEDCGSASDYDFANVVS